MKKIKTYLFPIIIFFISSIIVFGNWSNTEKSILRYPPKKIIIPVKWNNLGKKLVENGTIEESKFDKALVFDNNKGNLVISNDNAKLFLNLLWAFGLANKNSILENGPINDKKYGGNAGQFASTGGWTLAKGDAMEHYNHHELIILTPEQQLLVENVSKNIYRPCCSNPAYFPDCNHGMAMLGLLELMASQGDVSEEEMYRIALGVNSFWFPDVYLNIYQYLKINEAELKDISPKNILAVNYSSAVGYRQILERIEPINNGGGRNCGV